VKYELLHIDFYVIKKGVAFHKSEFKHRSSLIFIGQH